MSPEKCKHGVSIARICVRCNEEVGVSPRVTKRALDRYQTNIEDFAKRSDALLESDTRKTIEVKLNGFVFNEFLKVQAQLDKLTKCIRPRLPGDKMQCPCLGCENKRILESEN